MVSPALSAGSPRTPSINCIPSSGGTKRNFHSLAVDLNADGQCRDPDRRPSRLSHQGGGGLPIISEATPTTVRLCNCPPVVEVTAHEALRLIGPWDETSLLRHEHTNDRPPLGGMGLTSATNAPERDSCTETSEMQPDDLPDGNIAPMIDGSWIDHWADRYNEPADDVVLNQVGARVRERGHYNREDFLTVGRWKSQRAKSQMASNTDEMIRDITATAFSAPLPIQHRILTLLKGVAVPMASSLLMVWRPETHTVIDIRAVASLVHMKEMADPSPNTYPPYMDYLTVCTDIAERCNRGLRQLDRALYASNGRT